MTFHSWFLYSAPSEMLGQIEAAQRDLNIRISNIVLMGMGEPLDNFVYYAKDF